MITNPYTTSTSFYYSSQSNISKNQFFLAISTVSKTCSPTDSVNLYYFPRFRPISSCFLVYFFSFLNFSIGVLSKEEICVTSASLFLLCIVSMSSLQCSMRERDNIIKRISVTGFARIALRMTKIAKLDDMWQQSAEHEFDVIQITISERFTGRDAWTKR